MLRERIAEFMGWHYALAIVEIEGEIRAYDYYWFGPDFEPEFRWASELPAWDECRNLSQLVLERAEEMGLRDRAHKLVVSKICDHFEDAHNNWFEVNFYERIMFYLLCPDDKLATIICEAVLEAYDAV